MADIGGILAASYKSAGLSRPSTTPYVPVDPALYQGKWTGKYADQKSFTITVTDISGFRAKVRYQSDSTLKYQEVLIKDNAFRVGDTKFTLTKPGVAQIKNVVSGPNGTYLDTAVAIRS